VTVTALPSPAAAAGLPVRDVVPRRLAGGPSTVGLPSSSGDPSPGAGAASRGFPAPAAGGAPLGFPAPVAGAASLGFPAPAAGGAPLGFSATPAAGDVSLGFSGTPAAGWVALTFDDGPSGFRPETLEVLRRERVPAAFFDVGMRVAANPQVVGFQVREGHQVFNHTYHHPNLTLLTPDAVREEMAWTEAALVAAGVPGPIWGMRPPFLDIDDAGRDVLAGLGYPAVVRVDVFGEDPDAATTPERIREALLAGLAPGMILLLHDGNVDTPSGRAAVAALPGIIRGVRERGYGFGVIDERGEVVPAGPLRGCDEPIPGIVEPVPYLPLVERLRGEPPQDPPQPFVIVESPHQ
jgi:peptidoglycan/xylan/chitin deacetylase (PgdA/CDA1 family)